MVLCDIRENVDARDEYVASQKAAAKQMKKEKESVGIQFNHIYLGSPEEPTTIAKLAETHIQDGAFNDFRKNLRKCIRDLVSREDEADRLATTERVDARDVEVHATEQVR